jgi:hypothetical protein
MKALEEMTPALNAMARTVLGHTIQYHTGNGAWKSFKVQGNYEDGNISTGYSAAIEQEIELMLLKVDVSGRPASTWRFKLPRVPNVLFAPVNVQNDETAEHWLFNVKKVAV